MATENPRPEKVAVVDDVRERLSATEAAMLTEYRGLDVPAMAELRTAIRQAGGEYKIYKNTLVRFAAAELGLDIEDLLIGPTAIAFVGQRPDGSSGDAASLAKALRDFARRNDGLVIKGGVLDDRPLSLEEIAALADLPSRDQLFAELAGAMESMYQDFAGLLESKLREFAYALQEHLDNQGGADAVAESAATETEDAPADTEEVAEPAADADAAEAPAETDAADAAGTETDAATGGEEAGDEPQETEAPADTGADDNATADDGESEES